MKRGLSYLLALLLLLSLCACGKENPSPAASPAPAGTTAAPVSASPLREAFDNSGVKLQGTALGSLSCDTPFRTVFSEVWEVPEGESVQKRFIHYTDGLGLWDTFSVILLSEPDTPETGTEEIENAYAVLRADHFGSGSGYKNAVAESDWNWDTFCSDINDAEITLTVTNKGKTAEVSFTALTAEGTEFHQSYKDIGTDGPLYFCLTVENACLDLLPEE